MCWATLGGRPSAQCCEKKGQKERENGPRIMSTVLRSAPCLLVF